MVDVRRVSAEDPEALVQDALAAGGRASVFAISQQEASS
jgi:hypothetical protein